MNNEKIFCSIWNKNKNHSLLFISSNSGTGKTTHFKWQFLRRAVEHGEHFDIFFRWQDDLDSKFSSSAFLTPPPKASKRLLKLAQELEIKKENDAYFIVYKKDNRKIAQALAINTQSKTKSTENSILSCRALFDEVLADDNHYAPNECYKFARLIDTRARYRKYQVVCLYNNTTPFFPYKEYFENSGAKFIDFVAEKYGQEREIDGIQSILSKSNYSEVYLNNNFLYYKEFYKDVDTLGKDTLFYLNIEDKLFAVKDFEDFYILETKKKIKKNREVFAFNLANNDFLMATSSNGIVQVLQTMLNNRLLFANDKNNTIYIKELANCLNLCYTI